MNCVIFLGGCVDRHGSGRCAFPFSWEETRLSWHKQQRPAKFYRNPPVSARLAAQWKKSANAPKSAVRSVTCVEAAPPFSHGSFPIFSRSGQKTFSFQKAFGSGFGAGFGSSLQVWVGTFSPRSVRVSWYFLMRGSRFSRALSAFT